MSRIISTRPDPDSAFPNPKIPSLCFIKNVVRNPRIIIGNYTYYDDVDGADQFEKHVTHFYDFIGDKLIIGKFCAIANMPSRRRKFEIDMIWWFIFLAVILVLVGIAFLRGKCDGFIAGYNTSSPEKQKKYDIKRLRLIVACFHFALAGLFFLYLMKNADLAATIHLSCVAILTVIAVVLANTWAKKRGN